MRKQTGIRNPAVSFLLTVICVSFGFSIILGAACNALVDETVFALQFQDTNLTNPDINSLVNLEWDYDNDALFRVTDLSGQAQIGFMRGGRYYMLTFDPKRVVVKDGLKAYRKALDKNSWIVSAYPNPIYCLAVFKDGSLLSPFVTTTVRECPTPADTKFLHKVH